MVTEERNRPIARVGDKPINIPTGVEVIVTADNVAMVKGPRGELIQPFQAEMVIKVADGVARVDRTSNERRVKALHGLTRALLNNMVIGVSEGYERTLDIVGTGYRVQEAGEKISLQVGFSHTVEFGPISDVNLAVSSPTRIVVSGCDKQRVGQVAAQIRRIRPPDHYKGKGIRYSDEHVRLKPGKSAARN